MEGSGLEHELRGLAAAKGTEPLVIEQHEFRGWRAAIGNLSANKETREGALQDLRDAIRLDEQRRAEGY